MRSVYDARMRLTTYTDWARLLREEARQAVRPPRQTPRRVLIGMDGPGGSGKSTIARALARAPV